MLFVSLTGSRIEYTPIGYDRQTVDETLDLGVHSKV